MKVPKFDRNNAHWDQWKEFYIENAGFTFFESGEVIATDRFHTRSGWGHTNGLAGRGHKQWGVTVFQVSDGPAFLREKMLRDPVDGTIVKRSWLSQASPMVYDHDAKRVVSLQWIHSSDKAAELIPSRFVGRCAAYWPGEDRNPVGGGQIYYGKLTEWSKEERAEIKEKLLVIRAQVRVGAVKEPQYGVHGAQLTMAELFTYPVSALTDDFKLLVNKKGVSNGYTSCSTDYLEVVDV